MPYVYDTRDRINLILVYTTFQLLLDIIQIAPNFPQLPSAVLVCFKACGRAGRARDGLVLEAAKACRWRQPRGGRGMEENEFHETGIR